MIGGARGFVDAEERTDVVGGCLGHQPVGRQFAADDTREVFDAVFGVVQEDEVPRNPPLVTLARVGSVGLVGRVQRSAAPPGSDRLAALDRRQHFPTLLVHFVDLPLFFGEVVGIVDLDAGGSEDDLALVRDDDVAVIGVATPVEHRIEVGVLDAEHDASRGFHLEVDAGHRTEFVGPRAGRVDDVVGFDGLIDLTTHLDARNRSVVHGYCFDRRVCQHGCPVLCGTFCIGRREP